jgi:hypothetical protein
MSNNRDVVVGRECAADFGRGRQKYGIDLDSVGDDAIDEIWGWNAGLRQSFLNIKILLPAVSQQRAHESIYPRPQSGYASDKILLPAAVLKLFLFEAV